MIERTVILRMIENYDSAEKNAIIELEKAIDNVAKSNGIVDTAVAEMLRAMSYDKPMVQSGKKNKGVPEVYEWAAKQKHITDMILLQDLQDARWEYLKILTFARIFRLYIRALDREILIQKYKLGKKAKEITFNGRTVSPYEIRIATDRAVKDLQNRMAIEGFDK